MGRRAGRGPPEAPFDPGMGARDEDEPSADNALAEPLPRRRLQLDSLVRVRREMVAVYREARDGQRPVGDAARLTYMLHTIGRMIEGGELERRLEELERRTR